MLLSPSHYFSTILPTHFYSYHYSSYGCVQDLTIGVNAIIHLFLNNSLLRARKSQSIEGATKLGFHGVVTCRVSGDQNQPTEYLPTRDKVFTYSHPLTFFGGQNLEEKT